MSETTERSPLATIEAFEAGAFRVAHVARRLLADHPDLRVSDIRPHANAYQGPASVHAELEISTRDVAGVRGWADALGITVAVRFFDACIGCPAFEYHEARTETGGIAVKVVASRSDLTEAEVDAWRIRQQTDAKDGA